MSLKLGALALALTLQSTCVSAGVKSLTPANFYQELDSRTWMIMFAVTGCTHCKQMKPMWDEMARQIAAADDDVFVGRVNSTLHNGIARTLRVKRFPTVLLIGPTGLVYEFTGRRGLPPLLDYARGGYRGTAAHMQLPEELEPAVRRTLSRGCACTADRPGCPRRAGVRVLADGRGVVAAAQAGTHPLAWHRSRAQGPGACITLVPQAGRCAA